MSKELEHLLQVQAPISAGMRAKFIKGLGLLQQGRHAEAKKIIDEVLLEVPRNFGALHLLGIISLKSGNSEQGARLIRKAIELNAGVAIAHSNLGKALLDLKCPEEALTSFDKAIALKPDFGIAYNNRGNALMELKRPKQALANFEKAIALMPSIAEAHYGRGNALYAIGNFEEALSSYNKAILLRPEFVEPYCNRGNALRSLRRINEALASYDRAIELKPDFIEAYINRAIALNDQGHFDDALSCYEKIVVLKPNYAEAYYNKGNTFLALKRYEEAMASYENAIALKPDFAEVYNNRGLALTALMRREDALASVAKAIALNPQFAQAYNNRGIVLNSLKRHDDALASYDKAIELNPNFTEAFINRAESFKDLKRPEDAFENYSKAVALNPEYEGLFGVWLHSKMIICNWENLEREKARLISKIEHGELASLPFPVLSISDSLKVQKRCAETWVFAKCPLNNKVPVISKRGKRERIRVGYFSADFYDHATARLMAQLFEKHSRSRFEIIAFSFGPDKKDEMLRRLSVAFDKFIEVRDRSDREVAMLARELDIDIAVDLNGFTANCRTGIFAFRAAPIQVSYLVYPGTMGAEYIDYLIADSILIPKCYHNYYTEKIVYLPNSYQVNDSKRQISDKTFSRAEMGLPGSGFVFCCFNNNYKITPDVFDSWMRILGRVDRSVLWLLEDNAGAASNLRKEAEVRGVNPNRLVFAKRMPLSDHLARHRLADLFLDTLPYNAHTTASDALWAGLPVLTRIGETFASRVGASLLTAIGLPELITSTPQAYENLATELALNSEKLAVLKRKLLDNCLAAPLFDTDRTTKHIESALIAIYERYHGGLPPDRIYVPS